MNSADLLRLLRQRGPIHFVENCLFDDQAWIFPTRSGDEYEDVRQAFAGILRTEPKDIAVVGSGKYGFSLSPSKEFKPFEPNEEADTASDLDLVVVSRAIFNETWHHLRRAHYNGAIDARKIHQQDVFRRFITVGTDTENDTKYLRDLRALLDRVRKLATTRFGIAQTIKLRVYCSWTDAKAYHIWSAQMLGEKHGIQ